MVENGLAPVDRVWCEIAANIIIPNIIATGCTQSNPYWRYDPAKREATALPPPRVRALCK